MSLCIYMYNYPWNFEPWPETPIFQQIHAGGGTQLILPYGGA